MNKKLTGFFTAILILIAFFNLRANTFYLAHINNDELIYLGLAGKIDRFGPGVFKKDYNLYYLDLVGQNGSFSAILPAKNRMGSLAYNLKVHLGLEANSLSHHPPLLSYLLMSSHRIFNPDQPYLFASEAISLKNIRVQLYACIIPFLCSLFLVACIFELGRRLFSAKVGALAAFLLVATPADMLASQKIWADDLVSFLVALAMLLYITSPPKKLNLFAIFAGLAAGLGFLAKQSAVLAIFIIPVAHFMLDKNKLKSGISKGQLDSKLIFFFLSFLLVILPWVVIFIRNHGFNNFLSQYSLAMQGIRELPSPYLMFVNHRPWYTYLVDIPYQQPLFLFSFAAVFYIFKDKENRQKLNFLLFWFLLFLVLTSLMQDKEERYMLPAYPAITILSAYVFFQLQSHFTGRKGVLSRLARVAMIALVFLSFTLAANIGMAHVFARSDAIPLPF